MQRPSRLYLNYTGLLDGIKLQSVVQKMVCYLHHHHHHHHHYHHHLAAVAEISPTLLHKTVLFAMAAERFSISIPVSLEVSGKASFLPVVIYKKPAVFSLRESLSRLECYRKGKRVIVFVI